MTREALVTALCEDEEINVTASAVTAWHALGVEAWVLARLEAGEHLKGYICIEGHPVSGRLLSEQDFPVCRRAGLRIVDLEGGYGGSSGDKLRGKARQYGYFCKKSAQGRPLYYLKPVQPDYDMIWRLSSRRTVAVMLDEGLGSYTNTPFLWAKCIFQESGWKAGILGAYRLLARNPLWRRALQRRGQLEEFVLLQYKEGHWRAQERVAGAYRKVLEQKALPGDFSRYEGAVVINTDVSAEMGNIREDEDIRALSLVCAWCGKRGVPVVLKPHPRERRLERYQGLACTIDTGGNGIAQELIFAGLSKKPLCTVSMFSTTLVSASVLYQVPGIALNRLLDERMISIRKNYEAANRLLADFVSIPETEEELERVLDSHIEI